MTMASQLHNNWTFLQLIGSNTVVGAYSQHILKLQYFISQLQVHHFVNVKIDVC